VCVFVCNETAVRAKTLPQILCIFSSRLAGDIFPSCPPLPDGRRRKDLRSEDVAQKRPICLRWTSVATMYPPYRFTTSTETVVASLWNWRPECVEQW
jgi:hypothetical protein